MTAVAALSGKVKFVNTGKTQYRVETVIGGKRSTWKNHFDSYSSAIEFIEQSRKNNNNELNYLVTEVFTKTLGVF